MHLNCTKPGSSSVMENEAIGAGHADFTSGTVYINNEKNMTKNNLRVVYASLDKNSKPGTRKTASAGDRTSKCHSTVDLEICECPHTDHNGNSGLTFKDNGNGTHTAKCKYCGYEGKVEHTSGTCVCGHNSGKDETKLAGYKLSLDGDIGVNFCMDLSDEVIANKDTAYMKFTVPCGSSAVEEKVLVKDAEVVKIAGNQYYVFKCDVAAKDMNSDIKAQIVNGDVSGEEYTCTVKDYAKYIVDHASDNAEYKKAANLAKALLNYGSTTQAYFGVTGNGPANEGIDDSSVSKVTKETIGKSTYACNLPEGVTYNGSTLTFASETTLTLYFTSEETLTFSCKDPSVEIEAGTCGKYQVINIKNISAKKLSADYTITVSTENATGSITYSPMNYCYEILDTYTGANADKMKDVVRALYLYAEAADAYFNA